MVAAPSWAAPVTIVAFGDSLSAGYGLKDANGFAPVLEKELRARQLSVKVINAAVSGDTSAGGLTRVAWMLQDNPDLVIVEFGANDMFRGVPVKQIRKNLAGIIVRIQQSGARVLLAGMEAPDNYDSAYRSALRKAYRQLSEKYEVPLYPFFLAGVALRPSLNLPDGIHPNASGVRVIAEKIAPLVADMVRQLR